MHLTTLQSVLRELLFLLLTFGVASAKVSSPMNLGGFTVVFIFQVFTAYNRSYLICFLFADMLLGALRAGG